MTRLSNQAAEKDWPSMQHVVAARNSRDVAVVQRAPVSNVPWSPYTAHPSRAAGLRPQPALPGYPYPTDIPRDLCPPGRRALPPRHINEHVLAAMGSQFDDDGAESLPEAKVGGAASTVVEQNRLVGHRSDQRQYESTSKLNQQHSSKIGRNFPGNSGKVGFPNEMAGASK